MNLPGRRFVQLCQITRNPVTVASVVTRRSGNWRADFRVGQLTLKARLSDVGAIADVALEDDYAFLRGVEWAGGRPAPLVLDLGGNIGCFAAFALTACPGAEIHSVEPSPDTFAVLDENRRRHRHFNWHTHQLAIAQTNGPVRFTTVPSSTSRRISSGADGVVVQGETFDDFVTRVAGARPVALCKMDIEGAEIPILAARVEAFDRIERFVVEVHGSPDDLEMVLARLRASFPSVEMVAGRRSSKAVLHAWR